MLTVNDLSFFSCSSWYLKWSDKERWQQMCGVHLGTGMYLTFLEFRSVTSKNADVNGGVTSGRQKGEHVYILDALINLLWSHKNPLIQILWTHLIWTLTFGVDVLQGHLVWWKGPYHLIGWEQTDTIFLFGCAGTKPTSKEHVSPTVTTLHHW